MAFDEQGQADTLERKVEICTRAYHLLTEKVGFPPGILSSTPIFSRWRPASSSTTITASISSRLRAIRRLPARAYFRRRLATFRLPSAATIVVREAMHSVFLYHAIRPGMDMGIVNAGQPHL